MSAESSGHRFYTELATWWPLISPPEEYEREAAFLAGLLESASIPVHEVLELGSGGGHSASHLKRRFTMTLVDESDEMLAVSRALNPECEHRLGDMRTARLGRAFDAVLIHDAVDYMTDERDLSAAIGTAFAHCRPGGVAVFAPDVTAEVFEDSTEHGGIDAPDGRAVRYLEWTWDPDPDDSWALTEYAFLLREKDGSVRTVHETHRTGVFSRQVWFGLLAGAGFEPDAISEETDEDRSPRTIFVGRRGSD
ncbi:MAG TPA: class I SAM-dependent methyltransferase [Egibacteraceae bacterium]|nr:class I SAM-dependent methyltransferase [Egibacteraceae bacterium]